uniref:C2H2-type domain-containing protein n=1 Tax=Steinernema glaseri TaxID=37863 RepID=A0A1I7XZA1_9BILA
MNNLLRTCSEGGLDSPLGVSGLLGNGAFLHNTPIKTEPLDVTASLMGINPIQHNFHNMNLAGTSSVPNTPSIGGLSGLNFNNQGGPRSAPNSASHITVPELSLSLSVPGIPTSVASAPTPKTRHRSSPNDQMLKLYHWLATVGEVSRCRCRYCPKKFRTDKLLEAHKIECRLIRLHECTICGKRFKARGGLQQHHRIHMQDKPYICKYCPKRFTQKSHVDQHERIHTGDKPFTCQYCGRNFRQRSQQLGHEATHAHSGVNLVGRAQRASPGIVGIKEEVPSEMNSGQSLNNLAAMALNQNGGGLGDLHNFDVQQAIDMMSASIH